MWGGYALFNNKKIQQQKSVGSIDLMENPLVS
jgi:hypothetical protein